MKAGEQKGDVGIIVSVELVLKPHLTCMSVVLVAGYLRGTV